MNQNPLDNDTAPRSVASSFSLEKSQQQNGAPPRQAVTHCDKQQDSAEIKAQSQAKTKGYPCPCCRKPMSWLYNLPKAWLGVAYTRHSGPDPPN